MSHDSGKSRRHAKRSEASKVRGILVALDPSASPQDDGTGTEEIIFRQKKGEFESSPRDVSPKTRSFAVISVQRPFLPARDFVNGCSLINRPVDSIVLSAVYQVLRNDVGNPFG